MAQRTAYILGLRDKTTLALMKDENGRPILYKSPADFIPGVNPPTYSEVIKWPLYNGPLSAIQDICGVDWDQIPVSDDDPEPEPPVFVFGPHYVEKDIITAPSDDWRGTVEINDCDKVTFWGLNLANPTKQITARLLCDGVLVGRATARTARQDVVDAFATQGITLTTNAFGGRIDKPSEFRDNIPHKWELFFEETNVEFPTYLQPKIITCAIPPAPEYIVRTYLKVQPVLEGGPLVKFQAFDKYNTGAEKLRTETSFFDFEQALLQGVTLASPTNGELQIQLANNSISQDEVRVLVLKDGNLKELTRENVTFINQGCNRPNGLQTVNLSYRVKYPNNTVKGYATLDEANLLAGKTFDGTAPGNLDSFLVQVNGLYIGADVYLGTGTDCGKASDNIYYVTASDGSNTYKIAIIVKDGKIIDVKASTYSTNTPPIAGKIPDQTIIQGTSLDYTYDKNLFSDPGDTLTVGSVTLPNGVTFTPPANANVGGRFTGGSNLSISAYPVNIRATDSAGQSVDAPFTLNVIAANQPYIDKIAIYYPQYWRYAIGNGFSEGIGIFVSVSGPNSANATVNFAYTQSTLYTGATQLEKTVSAAANGNIPPMPGGYNRVSSIWWDERPIWSSVTRQLTITISGVANSAVTIPIKAVIGSADLSFTNLFTK